MFGADKFITSLILSLFLLNLGQYVLILATALRNTIAMLLFNIERVLGRMSRVRHQVEPILLTLRILLVIDYDDVIGAYFRIGLHAERHLLLVSAARFAQLIHLPRSQAESYVVDCLWHWFHVVYIIGNHDTLANLLVGAVARE